MKHFTLKLQDPASVNGRDVMVSTVNLSIDHGYDGKPLWYETMVFPRIDDEISDFGDLHSDRYETEDEAKAGHAKVLADCNAGTIKLYG
jgi:hypothetical protein